VSLHPIKALDYTIDEYADYLRTEFRAKDRKLQEALERKREKGREKGHILTFSHPFHTTSDTNSVQRNR